MKIHKKKYGLYHWDTFDNATILIDEDDSLEDLSRRMKEKYNCRFSLNGADRVDIVDENGAIVGSHSVC